MDAKQASYNEASYSSENCYQHDQSHQSKRNKIPLPQKYLVLSSLSLINSKGFNSIKSMTIGSNDFVFSLF